MSNIRIALCQYNFIVGDLAGNRTKILQGVEKAVAQQCDMVVFPELSISGYPPEDLLLRRQFIKDQMAELEHIAAQVDNIVCILGFVDQVEKELYNAAAVLHKGKISRIYHKIQLPNYSVFDEERYFEAGSEPLVVTVDDVRIGIGICEDIWVEECVTEAQAFCGGAEVLINISASPYYMSKFTERLQLMQTRARRCQAAVVYTNLVGGQDELVFDGQSLVVDETGKVLGHGFAFKEDLILVDLDIERIQNHRAKNNFEQLAKAFNCPFEALRYAEINGVITPHKNKWVPEQRPRLSETDEVYLALITGLHDYVTKTGFHDVVFGLSGGIDSALVAALAADALGPEHVHCVTLPSQFSSRGSVDDSVILAKNLGIHLEEIAIESVYHTLLDILKPIFKDQPFNVAEENLQARIRGAIVMALSNKFNWMALATGNKSEVSVGYCTIYGDMVGGFSPLKDVFKMWVYRLARRKNELAGYDVIPRSIIDKAPSAELRPDQKDEDSLPPYPVLDAILEMYVEDDESIDAMIHAGYDPDVVRHVVRLVDMNEYKRRQGAPGVKITPRAFGKDRRMPIVNKYRMK